MGAIVLYVSFFPSHTVLPNLSYWDTTSSIPQNQTERVEIGFLFKNDLLISRLIVYSDSPIVSLKIIDSKNRTVLDPLIIDGSNSLIFTAPNADRYYFDFNNTYSAIGNSSIHNKNVLQKIYYYGNYPLILQTLGLMPILGGILCIFEYLFYPLKKRPVILPNKTYEKLSEPAKNEGKSIEEVASEGISKLVKREKRKKRK
jgi:hypothetical protein